MLPIAHRVRRTTIDLLTPRGRLIIDGGFFWNSKVSFAPENEYMRYGMIGEIPQSMAPPSTVQFEADIDNAGRKAQAFLDMFIARPELASVYGPLTLEEANSNTQVSDVEREALKELINLPGIREGIERARRSIQMVKGV